MLIFAALDVFPGLPLNPASADSSAEIKAIKHRAGGAEISKAIQRHSVGFPVSNHLFQIDIKPDVDLQLTPADIAP